MTEPISFGKSGNAGNVENSKAKDLTKRENWGNNKIMLSIFDSLDANNNQVLEGDELQNLYNFLNAIENPLQAQVPPQAAPTDEETAPVVTDPATDTPAENPVVEQAADEIVPDTETESPTVETAEEEPQETRGIIVQNGESPAVIAKKFGVPLQDLLDANQSQLKGKGKNKYFLVGAEIVIPRKIDEEELAQLTAGRKSADETTADYSSAMALKAQRQAEAAEQREAQYKEMGLINHEGEGEKITFKYKDGTTEEYTIIGQCNYGRKLAKGKSGKIVTISHDNKILKSDYVQNYEKYETARQYKENVATRKNAENLAKQFYQIADENSGNTSMAKMSKLLDANVNENNIVAFLDAYSKESVRKGDSSIVDTITSEVGASSSQQRHVLVKIMNKLTAAAKKAGVSAGDINKAVHDFNAAMNKEFSAHARRTNPLEMENAIDFLRGAIVAKRTGNTAEISDKDAIAAFNNDFSATDAQAQKDYADARAEEGWAASVGDTVCGWFGCKTVEDMDKNLGANAAAVKKLASAKTEAEFKTAYKEVFGIEFDKNKIAARDTALGNYQQAQGLSSTINITSGILKKANTLDYNGLRNEIKAKFQLDDKTVDEIIQNYGLTSGKEISSDADKQSMLVKFLQETQSESAASYRALTKGKTLEQMGKDLELLHNSAFGTNNISKEVAQFNENMVVTEMVTEGVFEVAGTIALQFVPGLGQAAAARLAVSAARWGTKAVKVANAATKAEKAFAAVKNFQTGASFTGKTKKAAQITSQMLNAGAATASVEASNGRDAKTVMRKTLMNMSFAGVGASSSMLAPKLMQSFGITNKALANEIAEEIMNAAGSYGITKMAGDDYGSTDAFVDFATGIVMSRISHIGGGNTHVKPQPNAEPSPVRVSRGVKGDVNNHRDAIADGVVARNIDQQHLNANQRRMVEEELADVPTPEQQAAYDREIAYQPVPEADRPAFEAHQEKVAADYADAHRLENNARIVESKPADTTPKAATPTEIEKLTQSLADMDEQIKRTESNLASKAKRGKQVTLQEKQQLERMKANRAAKQAELDALQKPEAEVKADDVEPAPKVDDDPVAVKDNEKYSKDTNGFIKKENYDNMTPDELVTEYRRLSEYESTGEFGWTEPSPSGRIFRTNTHDMSANKYAIRESLEKRGLEITRDNSKGGDIPEYGYKKVEKSEPELNPEQAQRARVDLDDPATLSDEDLLSGINRLNNRRRYIDKNGVEMETNHTRRLRELNAELEKRGLKVENGKLVKPGETPSPEKIADDAQSIPESSIPAKHKSLWKSCQQRIKTIFTTGKELSKSEIKTVLADIKTVYNAVTNGKLKAQIAKLYNNVKSLAKPKAADTAPTHKPTPAETPTPGTRRSPEEIIAVNNTIEKINNAKTLDDIDKIQVALDRMPKSHPHKAELQRQLNEKSRALRGTDSAPVRPQAPKAPDDWEMAADSRSNGFKRNANAKTNITSLTPDEIIINGNVNGYSRIAGPKGQIGANADFRAGLRAEPGHTYSVYNAEANLTAITVENLDTFNRPGLFQIILKGQVSEADAAELMKIVKDKKLIPNMQAGLTSDVATKAKQIQEITADFFNKKKANV